MKTKYNLRCLAPDGEFVTEGEFENVEQAWNRAEDMGSRWFFYPVYVVTGGNRYGSADRCRIKDAPRELSPFIGRTFGTLRKWFATNPEMVCDWVNGRAPFVSPFPHSLA